MICNFNKRKAMEAIILEPKNKDDLEKIKKFASQNNIPTSVLDDEEFKFIERKKLADIADVEYPQMDISTEDINAIIKESRAEDYAKRNPGNH